MTRTTYFALFLLAGLVALPAAAAEPVFSDGGPDAEAYGKSAGYPLGRRAR